MNSPRISILLGITLSLALADSASANIIVNGSFEGSTYVQSTTGDVLPTGWINGPPYPNNLSDVNVESSVNPAIDLGPESGSNYVAFQSASDNGSRDCLYQDLVTVAGDEYNISFWVAITSTSVGNNLGLDVEWNEYGPGQITLDSNDAAIYAPTNTGPVAYEEFSYLATASTNLTQLDFHAVDANGAILLDNVVVTDASVPEPMSILLVASGLLVAVYRRRRLRSTDGCAT